MSANPPQITIKDPLGPQHLDQIKQGLFVLQQVQQQIAKAQSAGIDVTALQAQAADIQQKLTQIKNVYFPGQ